MNNWRMNTLSEREGSRHADSRWHDSHSHQLPSGDPDPLPSGWLVPLFVLLASIAALLLLAHGLGHLQ